MLKYWLWLTNLTGLQNQTRLALLRHFGSPEDIYYADEGEILLTEGITRQQAKLLKNHDLSAAERILADCQRLDQRILTIQDAAYPNRLRNIYDPPCLLYWRGKMPVLDEEAAIAVVGTRTCTPYGEVCAEKLGYGLASGGAVVVSGLAKGIDAAASRGALRAGGVTVGVVGNGLDVHYPSESRYLYEDIAAAVERTVAPCGGRVSVVSQSDGYHVSAEDKKIKALTDACESVLGIRCEPYTMGGGTYARWLPNTVAFGSGIDAHRHYLGAERGNAHQRDEYIAAEEFFAGMNIYSRAIGNLSDIL